MYEAKPITHYCARYSVCRTVHPMTFSMVTYNVADFILDLVILYIVMIFYYLLPTNCFHKARRCAPFLGM